MNSLDNFRQYAREDQEILVRMVIMRMPQNPSGANCQAVPFLDWEQGPQESRYIGSEEGHYVNETLINHAEIVAYGQLAKPGDLYRVAGRPKLWEVLCAKGDQVAIWHPDEGMKLATWAELERYSP